MKNVRNKNVEQTSRRVASQASAILIDPKATAQERRVAGSTLSQARPHSKRRGRLVR
jgi:hypothetical protein